MDNYNNYITVPHQSPTTVSGSPQSTLASPIPTPTATTTTTLTTTTSGQSVNTATIGTGGRTSNVHNSLKSIKSLEKFMWVRV